MIQLNDSFRWIHWALKDEIQTNVCSTMCDWVTKGVNGGKRGESHSWQNDSLNQTLWILVIMERFTDSSTYSLNMNGMNPRSKRWLTELERIMTGTFSDSNTDSFIEEIDSLTRTAFHWIWKEWKSIITKRFTNSKLDSQIVKRMTLLHDWTKKKRNEWLLQNEMTLDLNLRHDPNDSVIQTAQNLTTSKTIC